MVVVRRYGEIEDRFDSGTYLTGDSRSILVVGDGKGVLNG